MNVELRVQIRNNHFLFVPLIIKSSYLSENDLHRTWQVKQSIFYRVQLPGYGSKNSWVLEVGEHIFNLKTFKYNPVVSSELVDGYGYFKKKEIIMFNHRIHGENYITHDPVQKFPLKSSQLT